jgi:hypothetical protein
VHRRLYEAHHNAQEPEDPELTLKPVLNNTWKNEVTKKHYHNGKWEHNKIEGKECWSCCMNSEFNSKGCQGVKVDKKKWILSSYT